VFDRVVVDVVDVVAVVGVITYQVLPIPALPDAAFATPLSGGGSVLGGRDLFAEVLLDPPPAAGEIAVAGRKGGDAMQMVGQNHPCIDAEMSPTGGVHDGVLEYVQFPDEQVIAASFEQVHREEIGATRVPQASVVGHVARTCERVLYCFGRLVFGVSGEVRFCCRKIRMHLFCASDIGNV